MARTAFALLAALTALAGCAASQYRKAYKPIATAPEIIKPCPEEPGVNSPADPQAEGERLQKKGYASVGYVSFMGVVPDPKRDPDILAQAKRVGACRVVLSSTRQGSRREGFGGNDREVAVYEVSAIFFGKKKPEAPAKP